MSREAQTVVMTVEKVSSKKIHVSLNTGCVGRAREKALLKRIQYVNSNERRATCDNKNASSLS